MNDTFQIEKFKKRWGYISDEEKNMIGICSNQNKLSLLTMILSNL